MANKLGILFAFGLLSTLVWTLCDSVQDNHTSTYYLALHHWGDKSCNFLEVQFRLFTRKNVEKYQKVEPSREDILKSNYDPDLGNKILIHGFHDGVLHSSFVRIKDEYLSQNEYNVWIVDWSKVAAGPAWRYGIVVNKMRQVTKCLDKLVSAILDISRVPKNAFHIIGHGLGAHLAGFLAEALPYYKIARITGLDPAFPLFDGLIERNRILRKGDARFIDVIHTNCQRLGKTVPLGDIDFYVNGGFSQPGCQVKVNTCSHLRAVDYFAESIRSENTFYGWHCDSIRHYITGNCRPNNKLADRLMGEHVNQKATGTYIVPTKNESLYAMGQTIKPIVPEVLYPFSDSKLWTYLDEVVVEEPFNTLEIAISMYEKQIHPRSHSHCDYFD